MAAPSPLAVRSAEEPVGPPPNPLGVSAEGRRRCRGRRYRRHRVGTAQGAHRGLTARRPRATALPDALQVRHPRPRALEARARSAARVTDSRVPASPVVVGSSRFRGHQGQGAPPPTRGRSASARVRGGPRPVQTRGYRRRPIVATDQVRVGTRSPRRNPIADRAAPSTSPVRRFHVVLSQRRRDMAAAAAKARGIAQPPHTAIAIPIAAGEPGLVDTTATGTIHTTTIRSVTTGTRGTADRQPMGPSTTSRATDSTSGSASDIQVPSDTTATLATRPTRTSGWDTAHTPTTRTRIRDSSV